MKKTILVFLIAVYIGSLSAQIPPPQNQAAKQIGFSDDEYKFVSENYCSTKSKDIKVFEAQTAKMTIPIETPSDLIRKIEAYYADAKIPDATNDLLKNFNDKNDKAYLLEKKFIDCNYVLITKDEISKMFSANEDGWKKFKIRYPKSFGFERFSRIGFSPDKNQAILYYSYSCGWLCASGDYFFFVRENNKWVEKARQNLWVS